MSSTFVTLAGLLEAARARGPASIAVAGGHSPESSAALDEARRRGLAEEVFAGNPAEAVAAVREGRASILMKGHLPTSEFLRPVLDRDTGLRTGRLLSQVIAFQAPGYDRYMLMSDAAVNIAPNLEQKAQICRNAIGVAHSLGIERPNVALLAAVEKVSADMPSTTDAAALVEMNHRGEIASAFLDGPMAMDAPLSRFAAESKGIESPVVENTDIFLFPNIEAANIFYRALVYFAKAESGGVVVGAKAPIILLSRAESAATKLHSIALAVMVADDAVG